MKKILIALLIFLAIIIPAIIFAQVGVGPAPYCMPIYLMPPCNQPGISNAPGNSVNDFINSFNTTGALTNIVNNNSGCNAQNLGGTKNYMFWGCQHYLKVNPGQVITCNFQSGFTFNQGFALFVDWNNNGVFNLPGERLIGTPVAPAGTFISGIFTVPLTQAPGAYRLRVRCAFSISGAMIDPCNSYTYGECEDYMLYVGINPPGTGTVTLTSNSPVCVGQVVNINTTITGGSGSTTTYTYTWTGPNGFTSNQMNPSFTATSVAMSGIYTLNIAPGTGCNTTSTIQIWVNPVPFTSITNNGPLCQGSTATFSNSAFGTGALTYNWTGPNGFTSNILSPTISAAQPSNTGVYNFTIVSTFTNGGVCSATSNSSLAIVPIAQVSVTPSFTQCQGTNISFNANISGANSINWVGPNFNTTQQNFTLSNVTPANSGNYSVTATFTSPSTTLVCSSMAVSNVSVVPMNTVAVTPPQNVCYNTNIVLTATAAGNPNYIWTSTNGFSGTASSYTFNASPSLNGTYSVAAIFSIGSVSCTTYNSTYLQVLNPIVWNTIPANKTICKGDTYTLTALANGGGGNYAYTWSPTFGLSSSNGNIQTGTGVVTMVYNVNVYDVSCPQYTLNHTFTLNVNHAPIPDLQLETNKCEPFCAVYNSKVGASGHVNYVFNNTNIYPGDSVSICLSAGSYTLQTVSTGTNGCSETFTYPTTLNVYPTPIANFTWEPEDIYTVSKNKVVFYPYMLNKNYSYYWEFGNLVNSNEYTPTQIFDVQGNYPIVMIVTTEFGCADTIIKVVKVLDDVLIWVPNGFTPNNDNLNETFKPKCIGIKQYEMNIFDRWGAMIYNGLEWNGQCKGVVCQDGVYVYQITAIDYANRRYQRTGHLTLMK